MDGEIDGATDGETKVGNDDGGSASQTLKRPTVVQLAAGTYYWCTCGATSHPPFCDGTHLQLPQQAEAAGPLRWKLDEDRRVALCNCKKTANAPLCDGAHAD